LTEEGLVLISSTIKTISIIEFINILNKFKWEDINIEISAMPRKDIKNSCVIKLDKIPKNIKDIINSFITPIESISVLGSIKNCNISITALIEDELLKWMEITVQSENKESAKEMIAELAQYFKKN